MQRWWLLGAVLVALLVATSAPAQPGELPLEQRLTAAVNLAVKDARAGLGTGLLSEKWAAVQGGAEGSEHLKYLRQRGADGRRALASAMRDEHRGGRPNAARQLAEVVSDFGPTGAGADAEVGAALADLLDDAELRPVAQAGLTRLGEAAVPPLAARLRLDDPGARWAALLVLRELGPNAASAYPAVRELAGADHRVCVPERRFRDVTQPARSVSDEAMATLQAIHPDRYRWEFGRLPWVWRGFAAAGALAVIVAFCIVLARRRRTAPNRNTV